MALFASGPTHNHWNSASDCIGGAVLAVNAQFPYVFAVIGGNDDRQIVHNPLPGQRIKEHADVLIHIANATVIAVNEPVQVVHVLDLAGLPPELGVDLVVIHIGFAGAVWVRRRAMLGQDLLVEPLWQRLILERVAKLIGRAVLGMRVPVVHMQEPVVFFRICLDPLERSWCYFFCGLVSTLAGVIHLVEACIEPPRAVPLGEWADRNRLHPHRAQKSGKAFILKLVSEFP